MPDVPDCEPHSQTIDKTPVTYSLGDQDGVWLSGQGCCEGMLGNDQDLPWSASLCHVASYRKHRDFNLQGSWCKVCSKETPVSLAGAVACRRSPREHHSKHPIRSDPTHGYPGRNSTATNGAIVCVAQGWGGPPRAEPADLAVSHGIEVLCSYIPVASDDHRLGGLR